MKVAVVIPFFNDRINLKKCLDSLHEFDVYAIDGRYLMYPDHIDYSTDGSRELCSKYKNVCLREFSGFEVDKRNYCLEVSERYDYVLTLDSDEYIMSGSNIDLFLKNCEGLTGDLYNIKVSDGKDFILLPKLKNPKCIRYHICHDTYIDERGNLFRFPKNIPTIDGLKIGNNFMKNRSMKRQKEKDVYRNLLVSYEEKMKDMMFDNEKTINTTELC